VLCCGVLWCVVVWYGRKVGLNNSLPSGLDEMRRRPCCSLFESLTSALAKPSPSSSSSYSRIRLVSDAVVEAS
jgi:hypothetical protein